jgi:protocatechuate 3,4-dioxygenase beta subunit
MTVSATTSKSQYAPGENVTIAGRVLDNQSKPVLGASVSIQANNPQGTTIHVQLAFSDQLGGYVDSFALSSDSPEGQYEVFVTASKSGYETAQTHLQFNVSPMTVTTSTTASPSQTTITSSQTSNLPSKCFIATATYGSELSPEVALLRNFRDADVMQTLAGNNFMVAFNTLYYSFSPQVASFIASNSYLRAAMKIILYPLIGILYITSRIFTKLAFNPELAVTVSGIFASSAIGMVYLGPILVALSKLTYHRRLLDRTESLLFISASCGSSTVLLAVVEFVHLSLLMTIVTAAVVLSYIALGGFSLLYATSHARSNLPPQDR